MSTHKAHHNLSLRGKANNKIATYMQLNVRGSVTRMDLVGIVVQRHWSPNMTLGKLKQAYYVRTHYDVRILTSMIGGSRRDLSYAAMLQLVPELNRGRRGRNTSLSLQFQSSLLELGRILRHVEKAVFSQPTVITTSYKREIPPDG